MYLIQFSRQIKLLKIAVLPILFLSLSFCGPYHPPTSGSGSLASEPFLLRVTNGNTLGFYSQTGAYGFGAKTTSIFNIGTFGGTAQIAQNPLSGVFIMGQSCSGCNEVAYFNGDLGGFQFNLSLISSQIGITPGGKAEGVAVNALTQRAFVADSANNLVTIFNSALNVYANGSLTSSTFTPSGTSIRYLAVADVFNEVFGTDPADGTIVVLSGNGSSMATSPSALTVSGTGTPCGTGTLGNLISVEASPVIHVICNGSGAAYTTIIGTISPPTYFISATLAASTFSLAPLTVANDLAYDSTNLRVDFVGGSQIVSLSPTTGASLASNDLSTNDCGVSGVNLMSVAFAGNTNAIFVSDSANSRVYILNPTTLAFKNSGLCSLSNFQVPDVISPTKISFY